MNLLPPTVIRIDITLCSFGRTVHTTGLGMAETGLTPFQRESVANATRGTEADRNRGVSAALALQEALGRHDSPAQAERDEIRRIVVAVWGPDADLDQYVQPGETLRGPTGEYLGRA